MRKRKEVTEVLERKLEAGIDRWEVGWRRKKEKEGRVEG